MKININQEFSCEFFIYENDGICYRILANEEEISKIGHLAYEYASGTIKGRWPMGEEAIASSTHYAYYYALYVLKDRFKLGEAAIFKNLFFANAYKDRFGIEL